MRSAAPAVSADKGEWPAWADITPDPMQGPLRRWSWHATVWNIVDGGNKCAPGLERENIDYGTG